MKVLDFYTPKTNYIQLHTFYQCFLFKDVHIFFNLQNYIELLGQTKL